ncbi:HK97 gp10 family phage protein [Actinomadura rugatobispora]|uniref:HK97 gp10 family phage protein n=1 Tax=Actinomadura rugatobispora TaxID=1994 RepID=A0ABW0ZPX6_9ACTN|nr:hypothetical protein GCM10010200_036440 [Actinomadura rugatobispora]
MRITMDVREVRRLADDLGDAGPRVEEKVKDITERIGHDVVRSGQVGAPVDTGHLRATIGVDIDPDRLGFEAGPTASYGGHVEFGTLPHEIRRRPGGPRLHWVANGTHHFRERVWHPGTAPQPYMIPAFERHVPQAVTAMARAAGDIL